MSKENIENITRSDGNVCTNFCWLLLPQILMDNNI